MMEFLTKETEDTDIELLCCELVLKKTQSNPSISTGDAGDWNVILTR